MSSRPALELADIFRDHGPAWCSANAGHVSLGQLKVMSAIENCRTAALGGHVLRCENDKCGHTQIAYNSCRNRHCPKCQGAAAREWLAEREKELLPAPYFHIVFSLPGKIADIAYQNKAVIYDILFKASSETMLTIAADPKHLGARIGVLSVLHTWGSALNHHPHVHMIVPGGGFSLDGTRWVACRPSFFLAVTVLSALFRRLVLQRLAAAHQAGTLQFFGKHASLANARAFTAYLAPLRNRKWVVYCKRPFGGPEEVLRYLARYTHRVAISNRRLVSLDKKKGVTFKWKDYRLEGPERYKQMTLDTNEFIRRFLMHVLPAGFHRIRYYGFLTCQTRAKNIALARELLLTLPPIIPIDAIKAATAKPDERTTKAGEQQTREHPCPCCGGPMRIIETFLRGQQPKNRPTPVPPKIRIDTS
ncbi:MAG TPA: IS91 family transposase [Candidatus Binataceae bacterium]|nr:IS91 family transposase [Candidatus Binataceae bacterium]